MNQQNKPDPPAAGDSGEFYRRLCDCAAVAIIAADTDCKIVYWNAAAEGLLGASAEDMLGKGAAAAMPPRHHKIFENLLRRTINHGEINRLDVSLPNDKARQKHLLVIMSPITSPAGDNTGAAVWFFDETQCMDMSERLADTEKIASLGTLSAGVAHHFNNILGGVATFVDYALTSGDVTAMKRALQMTAEAAARAAEITQSLLSFAEHDQRRADMADLTEVVLTFSHLVERPLSEKNIQLKLDLKPVPVTPVESNRMHQVLGNLLTNSEEAMPDGGTITISLERLRDEVLLSFSDTGRGINQAHLPLVFEPFFTTKGLLAGGEKANPGLGLSVVYGIITEMGGRIEVTSPLQGAKFIIALPIAKEKSSNGG